MIYKLLKNNFINIILFLVSAFFMVELFRKVLPYFLIFYGFDVLIALLLATLIVCINYNQNLLSYFTLKLNSNSKFYLKNTTILVLVFFSFYFTLSIAFEENIKLKSINISNFIKELASIISQAISEELFFRGIIFLIIYRIFKKPFMATILSSFVFTIAHVFNPNVTMLALMNTFLAGFFLSFMILKSNSLWPAVAFHILWNLIQSIVIGSNMSGYKNLISIFHFTKIPPEISGGDYGLENSILTTIFMIISISYVQILSQQLMYRRKLKTM